MRRVLLFLFLLCCGLCATAQKPTSVSRGNRNTTARTSANHTDTSRSDSTSQGIIYNHKEQSNSELSSQVHIFHYQPGDVKIEAVTHPDMEPTGVEYIDALDGMDSYYLGRGYGQVHYSLFYQPRTAMQLQYQPDANAGYSRTTRNLRMYQTLTPYTAILFGSSLHSDYRVGVSHTQNVVPRWNIAFNADFIRRNGVYTQSGVKDKFLDFTTNYYSTDARYQLQAGVFHQSLEQDENGGVSDDSLCWTAATRSGVPVELYSAANRWRSTGLFVHQSYNTVRQFDGLRPHHVYDTLHRRDTIIGFDTLRPAVPKVLNTGVFAIDIEFNRHKRNYFDNDPSHFTYHFVDTAKTYDSTITSNLSARLFWTNDAYMHPTWQNPWVVALGVKPELAWMPVLNSADPAGTSSYYGPIALQQRSFFSLSSFFASQWSPGHTTLTVQGEAVHGSYRNGDAQLSAAWQCPLGRRATFGLSGLMQRQSPDFFYYQYAGNNAHWYYADDYYAKQHTRQLNMDMALHDTLQRLVSLSLSATQLDNLILCDGSPLAPFHQYDEQLLLLQGTLKANLHWHWLHLDMLQMVQHSSHPELMDVPLFASKNALYADFPVFHGALRLQTGINVRYFTHYHADAWKPYYGLFVHQDDVEIGNYAWCDFFLTAQIKRACIFVKVGHLNALMETDPHYFTLPHYPGEDLNVYFGATWKFFD